ncbi:MAG: hypothetical protein FWF02_07970 [Micrococcales bacterium]|nr:hypothetical protein [Micrococcales bacterium]MCL2667627.1 hypothetical protein [Micrococcales bacterium]
MDERTSRRIGVDQLFVQVLGGRPEPVTDIGVPQLGERAEQGRLVHSHRAVRPFVSFTDRSH